MQKIERRKLIFPIILNTNVFPVNEYMHGEICISIHMFTGKITIAVYGGKLPLQYMEFFASFYSLYSSFVLCFLTYIFKTCFLMLPNILK